MTESLVRLKTKGEGYIQKQKWEHAEREFSTALDRLSSVSCDEDATLKCDCLQGRAIARLFLNKLDESLADGKAMLTAILERRPDPSNLDKTDPMTSLLAIAHLRIGQAHEMRGELLPAMQSYAQSAVVIPDGDGARAKARLWGELGMVEIDKKDTDLSIFIKIADAMLEPAALETALAQTLEHLATVDMKQLVGKYNASGVCRLFYGVIQIYYKESPKLMVLSLNCLTMLAAHGASDVWMGYKLLEMVASVYKDNFEVFVELLHLMQYTPSELFEYLGSLEFIGALCDSLVFEYSDIDLQTVFYLIFQSANTAELLAAVVEKGVVKICFKHRTTGSFLLLSKLSNVPAALQEEIEGGMEGWAMEVLENKESEGPMVRGALIFMTRIMLGYGVPEKGKEKDPVVVAKSEKLFDVVTSILLANTKVPELVTSGFALLSLCVPFAPDKVTEKKLITAASVMMSVFNDDASVASNIMTFLYECATNGKLEEILQTRAALPTAMKALRTHQYSEVLVERAVGLAVLCNHPKKEILLQSALVQYPESKILKQYIHILPLGV